jgi:hypothetical protein
MSNDASKIRITGATPPMDLWRRYPLWEYCVAEERRPGRDEGTLRPSRAKEWRSRFDHSASYDLAMVFGEATLADGRVLPAELSFCGAPVVGREAGPELLHIYHSPPSVAGRDRWTLAFERIVGRWVVPFAAASPGGAAGHVRSTGVLAFELSNPNIFPLTVRTFAPRYAGKPFELFIGSDGIAEERSTV